MSRGGGYVFGALFLLERRITQKLPDQFSWDLVAGCSIGQGRAHPILEQIQMILC